MVENVGQWRKRAQRLRALARITQRPQARTELIELAKQWETMALKVESSWRRRLSLAGD